MSISSNTFEPFQLLRLSVSGTALLAQIPLHPYYFDAETAHILSELLDTNLDETCHIPLRVTQRRELLDGLIVFMRLHAPVMKDFHSHEVLKTVLE